MNSIAMQNLHVKDAVYHYILSWQEDENPSDDQVFDSVKYSLKRLGMEENQYVAGFTVIRIICMFMLRLTASTRFLIVRLMSGMTRINFSVPAANWN